MAPRRRNPVKTLFKKEELTPFSVIILKEGSAMDRPEYIRQLGNSLAKRGLNQVIILRLGSLDEFHILNEPEMNRLGWFRKESDDGEKPSQHSDIPVSAVPAASEPAVPG